MMKAKFNQSRNDLHWSIYDSKSDKMVRWTGYDDEYWWYNVANTEKWQTNGRYRLNPRTDEVTIYEET